jgi:DNA-binding beta-propeller fold protein YncE
MRAALLLACAAVVALLATGCAGTRTVTVTETQTQTVTASPVPATQAQKADFTCSMDRPGVSGFYTLTIANPNAETIYVATVQLNFADQSGTVIDSAEATPGLTVQPEQSVVFHGAEEEAGPPSTCQETSWSSQ